MLYIYKNNNSNSNSNMVGRFQHSRYEVTLIIANSSHSEMANVKVKDKLIT